MTSIFIIIYILSVIFALAVGASMSLFYFRKEKPLIPYGATDIEIFHIARKGKVWEAFIGFNLPNGNFHYVQVPYNPKKNNKYENSKVTNVKNLSIKSRRVDGEITL